MLRVLNAAVAPIGGPDMTMPKSTTRSRRSAAVPVATTKKRTGAAEPRSAALALAAAAEAAIADLEVRLPLGMAPLEQVLAARLQSTIAELRACAEQLGLDGLVVEGSMGQPRPHPLLKRIGDLRGELAAGLKDLTFRAENTAILAQLTPRRRRQSDESEEA
jgi:hypothetical protein